LHRRRDFPPLLRDRIGRHLRLISRPIVAVVLHVGEEQVVVPEDRVIVDVARRDGFQHPRPDLGVNPLVLGDVPVLDLNQLRDSLHRFDPSRLVA